MLQKQDAKENDSGGVSADGGSPTGDAATKTLPNVTNGRERRTTVPFSVKKGKSRLKASAQQMLGNLGLYVSSTPLRPALAGKTPILGSFPPYDELQTIGKRQNYFIHDGYEHRQEPRYFDDTANSDDWQDEVYAFAKEIADTYHLRSVADIGCGSAFKLLKYFHNRLTIGLDVTDTCAFLREAHPDRRWEIADFSAFEPPKADLVVASDVIEHVTDPDSLLSYIVRIVPLYVVISTPDRNLLRRGTHNGPPSNPAHLREWGMAELHAYLSEFFDILEHFISYAPQGTQCVLAKPR